MPNDRYGWRSPLDDDMERSFPQMPIIDQRTGTVNVPQQQMPRGTGFGQQGGYEGQVYNTPMQPRPQPMQQPAPMPQPMPRQRTPQEQALRNQFGLGGMEMTPQLSPEQIMELQRMQRLQELDQMYMQERMMKGMLGE